MVERAGYEPVAFGWYLLFLFLYAPRYQIPASRASNHSRMRFYALKILLVVIYRKSK
jgi:hypothetical protein